MEDNSSGSSWDDLLKQIGAAPAPDALERKRPAIENPVESSPPPKPAPRKQKASDWGALNSQLGLEAPAEDEPAPAPPPAPPRRREPAAKSAPPASRPPAAKSAPPAFRPPAAEDIEAGFATIEPLESQFEEIIEEELTDVEFAEQDDSDLLDEGLAESSDEPEGLSGDAARSAFEALFSAGSFSAMPEAPAPAPARRREFRRDEPPRDLDARPRRTGQSSSREDNRGRETNRGDEDDRGRPRDGASDEDDGGDRPRRRRRRRGRGRGGAGRGDQREGAPSSEGDSDGETWSDEASDEPRGDEAREPSGDRRRSDEGGDRPPRRRSRRGRGGGSRQEPRDGSTHATAPPAGSRDHDHEDDLGDDDDLGPAPSYGDESDEEGGGGDRSSHKGIPTWSEAIGMMVENNIQSRKNSPGRPSSSRERGGRGRGRGGRGGGRRRPS